MLVQAVTIARNTFVEAIRQPIYLLILLLGGLLQVVNTWITGFSMGYSKVPGEVTGDNKLLLDIGLSTVFVAGMILASFIATSAISREIERKTVLTVVSKPIGRSSVVIGKYLGIAGAMIMASVVLLVALLLAIRHGVLSTAADDPDQPVIVFSLLAVTLALGIGAVCNYLYGWSFPQTAAVALVPLLLLAYAAVLVVGKKWKLQPITTDLKPQITLAALSMTMALLVISAIATAASTRLGQVMTVTVCAIFFIAGLLANAVLGRHVFDNQPVAEIADAVSVDVEDESFTRPGSEFVISFVRDATAELPVGSVLYWGPSPSGVPLTSGQYARADAEGLNLSDTLFAAGTPAGVVVTQSSASGVTLKHVGNPPVRGLTAPRPGDWVFQQPTRTNPVALAAWGLVPNMQTFWLVDAISQVRPVPATHMALLVLYAACQIAVFLAIAVFLFQTRDVG